MVVVSGHSDDEKKPWKLTVSGALASGDEGARTLNPRLAKPVLSQLSYVPICGYSGAQAYARHVVILSSSSNGRTWIRTMDLVVISDAL